MVCNWKIKLAIADCKLMTCHAMNRPMNIFLNLFSNNTLTIYCLSLVLLSTRIKTFDIVSELVLYLYAKY